MYRRSSAPTRSISKWEAPRNLDDVLMWIQRLVRSPGYRHRDVTSAMVQRFLPRGRSYDAGQIRQRLRDANLDQSTIDYMLITLRNDYQAACAAAA